MLDLNVSSGLRKMQAQDLAIVLSWRNHPKVRGAMYSQHEISLEEHERWFAQAELDQQKHLLIYEDAGKPLGFMNLTIADPVARRVVWGFYLAPEAARGSGKALCAAALNHAFSYLGMNKVCGEVLDFNERSIRLHERLGFKKEGELRQHHFNGDHYHSILIFGILREEWKPIQEGNN